MPCRNCGSHELIKAHLIPRAFAVEVKVGKSIAAGVKSSEAFTHSQSGIWDDQILCGRCDGVLGRYENYTLGLTKRIRACPDTSPWQQHVLSGVDSEYVLKFCAGILYKFSLTTPPKGRIGLGRYQDVLRRFLFEPGVECPPEIDALIIRPLRFPSDDGVFAYRAPRDDRQHGLNCYRMMMGGVIFFVFLDSRGIALHSARDSFIKGESNTMIFTTVPAQAYEEFAIPARLVNQGRLSDFLDRVEGQN